MEINTSYQKRITKHGTSHYVLIPNWIMKVWDLKNNDEVYVKIERVDTK